VRLRPQITRMMALGAILAVAPTHVDAQPRARSFEVSAAALWSGGASLGRADATETRNQIGGDPFTLFVASSELDPGVGGEARVAFYLTPRIALEGGGLFARHRVATRITSDVEGIPDVTARADLTEFVIDAALAVHLAPIGRLVPFVRGGVGYLRQLHEDGSLVETGRAYHAGGGVSLWFSSGARRLVSGWGLRGDARLLVRDGGFSLGEDRRTGVAVTGALLIGF
jgi:hypothetical protein